MTIPSKSVNTTTELVDDVFDVSVETLSGDTFEVTMGSDDNKVLALKRKISKQQGTSMARQDLLLVDGAEGEGGKSEDPEEGMAVVDRVALRDDAALAGACSVVLYVKDSGAWFECCSLLWDADLICLTSLSAAKAGEGGFGEEACSRAEEARSGD